MPKKNTGEPDKQIQAIKEELMAIGPMRPGTLTQQYRDPGQHAGAYYQLSYTHKMKSRTEYVRAGHVERLRGEIEQ